MMNIVKFDLAHSSILINSFPIVVDEKGHLTGSIAKLFSAPTQANDERTQYRSLKKSSVCGKSTDVLIEVGDGKVHAVTFLFDLIEFFESSILESKILKAFEKTLNVKFISNHPSTAFFNFDKSGQAVFYYDAKQGDMSLDITLGSSLSESDLNY